MWYNSVSLNRQEELYTITFLLSTTFGGALEIEVTADATGVYLHTGFGTIRISDPLAAHELAQSIELAANIYADKGEIVSQSESKNERSNY